MTFKEALNDRNARWAMAGLVVVVVFLGSYTYALAIGGGRGAGGASAASLSGVSARSVAGLGCSCCGSGAPSGQGGTAAAKVSDGVQRITVDLSKDYYEPSRLELKAGVPAEITFAQGSDCLAQVQSQDLGFFEDLTSGPRTVRLSSPKAGTYSFSCGMAMVFGTIVVG